MQYFPGRIEWPNTYKKGVLRLRCDLIIQNSFRARTSKVEIADTGSKKMVKACEAKIARGKIPTRYQGMALRITVNADF